MPPHVIGPRDGTTLDLVSLGVRFLLAGDQASSPVSIVEHPVPARGLAAPLHRHSREDEYSFVLEGRMGAELDGSVVTVEAGSLLVKPRGQWHTFWNPDDRPCRILEIIAPGGFERFFQELGGLEGEPEPDHLAAMGARYGVEFDFESILRLCEEHGLRYPEPDPPS
ncbi:cupin domain-containing protein [Lysobacter korlensis]|uniref:Cupin domain-containing protein n=1 Tax=Lysobacter korlensis TaxID=553636 RepID=A0ABV6RWL5_9GAMM